MSGVLDIARAGHPDPMIRMADGTVLVRPTPGGLPLGIDPDADYPTTRLVLEPGETMLLCTDGLIETGGHDLDTGWRRIRTILESFDAGPHEGEGAGGPGTGGPTADGPGADGPHAGGPDTGGPDTGGPAIGGPAIGGPRPGGREAGRQEAGGEEARGPEPGHVETGRPEVAADALAAGGAEHGDRTPRTPEPTALAPARRPEPSGLAPGRLEALADALVQGVHGPSSHHTPGPLADRREDDIAMLLLCRESEGRGQGDTNAVRPPVRRTALTVAQAEPERIAGARQQVRELLHDWSCGDQVDSAVLLVSEMLTNVLVHTDADALLIAEMTGDGGKRRMRVEVTDASDDLPHKRHPGELASSGRGLVLMDVLADAWGVDPRGDGKSIWFELYETAPPDGSNGRSLN